MSMGGFNLSTHKKDDTNVRSRVQDIKKAKYETRKLETEGKKMEERLMELKLAMNREKEERERHGGGFWKTGQQGSLNTYADEVLAKKKNKSAGKTKIKILKDKPLDLPERSNQPGTMAYIAQRGAHTPRDKPKGPKCGQCEEKGAAVSCVQCAEDYCAGCFAAFHLKGNLKKHRSVPLTATPRQCFASPRPNPSQTSSSHDYGNGDGAVMAYEPNSARRKSRNSPEGASGTYENNLLTGSYNEADQAASFQEALNAWRQGQAPNSGSSQSGKSDPREINQTPRGQPYSPVQTPTVNVDSATGTLETQQDIEIKFNTSTISYADKLLLKKHRRTDVDALFTPREGNVSARGTPTPRKTPRPKSRGLNRPRSTTSVKIEDFNENDFDDEEDRVDFQALFEAVKMTNSEPHAVNTKDTLSIVEVQASVSDPAIEQSKSYKIEEEGEAELWSTDSVRRSKTKEKIEVKPPTSAKSSRRKSAKRGVRQSSENLTKSQLDLVETRPTVTESEVDNNSFVLGAKLNDIQNEFKREKSKADRVCVSPFPIPKEEKQNPRNVQFSSNEPVSERRDDTDRPLSTKPRPQSSKSRPQSGKKSRPQTGNRANSRQGSRPTSRATSRAASRLENPGLLTKAPSDALQQIARMTPTSDPYKGIDSFFMVGVQPSEQEEERTLTPTQHKNKEEKIKVSYQLYNMAPKSWKPDYSTADMVDTEDMEDEDAEEDRASSVMAYHAYSEQMVSDITERLISRFGELPLDEDAQSDNSSGGAYRSLGEEYRTISRSHSSSLHNSPIYSGRNTPVPTRPQNRETSHLAAQTPRQSQDQAFTSGRKSSQGVRGQTPRQPPRSRAQTPRVSVSKKEVPTPRRSKTYHEQIERPESRAIVMDGKDLSFYDDVGTKDHRNQDDEETLDQLEWELASQSGRVTAEGKISRMEIMDDPMDSDSLNDSMESYRSMSRLGQDKGYDINSRLRQEELEEDHDGLSDDEDNVRNLM